MDDIFYLSDRNISVAEIYRVACTFFSDEQNFSLLLAGDVCAFQVKRGNVPFLDVSELEGEFIQAEIDRYNRGLPVFCFSFRRHDLNELSAFLIFVMEKIGGRFGMDHDGFEPIFGKDDVLNLLTHLTRRLN